VDADAVDEEAVLASLQRMAGDPALARVIKATLQRLADGLAGPEFAEVATDVLAGRVDLRDIGRSSVYGETFTRQISQFSIWYNQFDEQERDRLIADARGRLSELDNPEG
jgi:hypothetical protein